MTIQATVKPHDHGGSYPYHRRSMLFGSFKKKICDISKSPKPSSVGSNSFSCIYRNSKGTLFTSSDGVYFVGKKNLFVSKTFHIRWSDILEIANNPITDKHEIGRAPSISLITNGDKSTRHDFVVKKPKQALKTLVSMHGDSMHAKSDDVSTTSSCDTSITASVSSSHHQTTNTQLQDEWKQIHDDESFSNHALQDKILPCTLDTFFDEFVADTATHSVASFQEYCQDVDISVTPWKLEDDGSFTRTVEFMHAIDLPFAPPLARARKEQRYRRFGQYGLVLETSTHVSDVPYSSCFYVADRVLVEPISGGREVVVHAQFNVVFVKKFLFQSLTASATGRKYVEGFEKLEQYWSNALKEVHPKKELVTDTQVGRLAPQSPAEKIYAADKRVETCDKVDTTIATQTETTMSLEVAPSSLLFTRMQCTAFALGLVSVLMTFVVDQAR